MLIFAIIICFATAYAGYKQKNNIVNPISIYCLAWAFAMIMSAILIYFYGGIIVNDRVYVIIILSVVFFSMGSLFNAKMSQGNAFSKTSDAYDSIKHKTIILLHIIAYFIVIPKMISSVQYLASGVGMYFIRHNLIVGDGTSEFTFNEMLKQVTVLPIFTATIYVAIDELFHSRSKKNYRLLLLAIADIIIYTVTYLGRFMIQNAFVFIVFVAISSKNISNWSPKVKRRIRRIVILSLVGAIVALVYITQNRSLGSGNGNGVIYTVVAYFGGPLKYFDTGIDVVKQDHILLYGSGLFSGLWDIILIPVQTILGIDFLRPLEYVTMYNTPLRQIGASDLYLGAFGTVFLNMYLDGRLIGIIIDSTILGIISSFFYNKFKTNSYRRYRVYYYTWIMFLFWSMLYWDGNRMGSILVFFYVMLMTTGRKLIRLK